MDNTQPVSIEDLKNILESVFKTDIVPFLWGPPGVGKSSAVRQICEKNDWDIIDLRLSLLNPVDLRGLPMLDKKKELARWLSPSFLPSPSSKRTGVLFLDEINLAPQMVQAAAYQLILDKRLGEYTFPKHWKIIAAGNREIDQANVYRISAPLANRFIHFTVDKDFDTWAIWAKKNNIRPEVMNFLFSRPKLLLDMPREKEKSFPSPRSWEFLSELLNAHGYKNGTKITFYLEKIIQGTIGMGTAKEFINYLEKYNIQRVDQIVTTFLDTGKLSLPSGQAMRLATITAIFTHLKKNIVSDKIRDTFSDALTEEEREAMVEFIEENKKRIAEKFGETSVITGPYGYGGGGGNGNTNR